MAFHRRVYIILLFMVSNNGCATAIKTDTWPPRLLLNHYDVKTAITKCLDITKADIKQLEEFEKTIDFDHLPSDQATKCYMHCLLIEFNFMKPDSPAVYLTDFLELMNLMEDFEQDIYLKMSRGCNKKSKDYCEMVYQMNVCTKKNDNEHYYLLYESDLK